MVADFELASALLDDAAWRVDDDTSPFFVPSVPEAYPGPMFGRDEADREQANPRWPELTLWMRLHDLARVQEAVLTATDAQIARFLCRGRGLVAGDRPATGPVPVPVQHMLDDLLTESRDLLLSHPLHVPLPALPAAPGDRETFATAIRHQLHHWQQRWPALTPLVVPVKVTLLVAPPPQGRDLDNLALEVLPLVHQILAPHPQPWLTRFPALSSTTEDRAERDRVRRLAGCSVTSYEVIQLRRSPTDPPNGLLRLALGSATTSGSVWSRISRYVDHWMEASQGWSGDRSCRH